MGYKRNYKNARKAEKTRRNIAKAVGSVSGAALGFIGDNLYGAAAGYYVGRSLARRSFAVRPKYRNRRIVGSAPAPIYGTPYAPGEKRKGFVGYRHYVPRVYFKKRPRKFFLK